MAEDKFALLAGTFSLSLIIGAMWFQYFFGVLPCEVCLWQRWPHDAAVAVGLGGCVLYYTGAIDKKAITAVAWITLLLILSAGSLGFYHALVEWKIIPGPSSCSGERFVLTAGMDLNAPVIRCDEPGWRLFGLSLAGYNAIFSLGTFFLGTLLLTRKIVLPVKWLKD